MNFQFYQAQGLVPTGVPVYGASQPGSFLGQPIRGLLGAPPGLLAQTSAGAAGTSALHANQAAAMLRGMGPPGFASQSLGQPGQTVVAGVAGMPPVARYLVPTSQQMGGIPGMYVIPGGVVQSVDPSALMASSGSPPDAGSAVVTQSLEGKRLCCPSTIFALPQGWI